ncbi:MAG TPA: MFS transporter [Caldilineaceae bacterium]|nr:MFS transporter [Caldilineaceae bacterium]
MSFVQCLPRRWLQSWTPARRAVALLLGVPLIDELAGGLPVLALPVIQQDLGLTYLQVGWLFALPTLAGLLADPLLHAASDFLPKRPLLLGGMGVLAAAFLLAAASQTFAGLLLAFALVGLVNSGALGAAQGLLIDRAPAASLQVMTRWTLTSAIGDLLAPIWVTAVAAFQLGWRFLLGSGAFLWAVWLLALLPQRLSTAAVPPATHAQEGFSLTALRANLADALKTPLLLRWLGLTILPTALDEIFLGFAGLFLRERLALEPAAISMALGAPLVTGLLSLALLERLRGYLAPVPLLALSALIALAGLLCFVFAGSLWAALLGLALTGFGAATWYPIAKAGAYTTLPGRSGAVRALVSLGAPFEIGLPLLIGAVAEGWGIQAGISTLLLAPAMVLLLLPRPLKSTKVEA